jgi:hypothetical protein
VLLISLLSSLNGFVLMITDAQNTHERAEGLQQAGAGAGYYET